MNIEIPEIHAEAADAFGDGYAAGAAAERARIAAILDDDSSKARQGVARKLAFDTDMDVATALAIITASAEEQQKPRTPPLAERHAAIPGAGAEAPGGAEANLSGMNAGAGSVMRRAVERVAGQHQKKV